MNTFKTSAIKILSKYKKPLSAKQMADFAIEEGLLETNGLSPQNTMGAHIYMDIKLKGSASDFIKVKKGLFDLNKNKTELYKNVEKIIEEEKKEEEKIKIESSFTGKGGEYLVASELLFRGFNASIMSVDVGVDISAIKDNNFFGIQVKTSNLNNNTYNFHIRKSSFKQHNHNNTFYIFVLKGDNKNNFIILSSAEIEKKIKKGAIYEVNKNGYALSVKIRNNNFYLGRRDFNINYYLNNWDLIK